MEQITKSGVGLGKDHTLFALIDGTVHFKKGFKGRSFVEILPVGGAVVVDAPAKAAVVAEVAPTPVVAEVVAPVADVAEEAPAKKAKKAKKEDTAEDAI